MSGYLLDTNVVSEPGRPRPEPQVLQWLADADPSLLYLSAFTQAEMRKGIVKLGPGRRADMFERRLRELRVTFAGRILPLDDEVLDRWGQIVGGAEARGVPVSGTDALFAATALHHNLVLVTRNIRDMQPTGAMLFDPWTMAP